MSDPAPPSPAPAPARPRRPLALRLLPVIIGLGGAIVVGYLYGAQPVQLLVQVPAGAERVQGVDLRVVRTKDSVLVLTARREKQGAGGRTVVVETKLPRGTYRVEAWPVPQTEPPTAWEAPLTFDGEESLEVALQPRPPVH